MEDYSWVKSLSKEQFDKCQKAGLLSLNATRIYFDLKAMRSPILVFGKKLF
jgi:hypothetical protein